MIAALIAVATAILAVIVGGAVCRFIVESVRGSFIWSKEELTHLAIWVVIFSPLVLAGIFG